MILKNIYRFIKWYFIVIISLGKTTKLIQVNPRDIQYGQIPQSQFPAGSTYKFVRSGDWDEKVLPITEHLLYRSYKKHFIEGGPWEETPFYKMALDKVKNGGRFRGEYGSKVALKERFRKCDDLYAEIKHSGFKSNHDLYKSRYTDNILSLLDEVTVNISRSGELLLNDGWHRFVSAHLLGLPNIPVRILVRHKKFKNHIC